MQKYKNSLNRLTSSLPAKKTVYKNSSFFMYFNKNNGKGRKNFL